MIVYKPDGGAYCEFLVDEHTFMIKFMEGNMKNCTLRMTNKILPDLKKFLEEQESAEKI